MSVEIKSKIENKILSRVEAEAMMSFDKKATPSGAETKIAVAKALGAEADTVVIKKIHTLYGKNAAEVTAYHYLNKEVIPKLEPQLFKKPKDAKVEQPAK